jgi:hypothetical protein
MGPPDQGLRPDDDAVAGVDLWLVIQIQLAIRERLAQVARQRLAGLEGEVHFLLVELIVRAARVLRPVHGHVGVFHDLLRIVVVERADRDPDAGADVYLLPL